MQVAEDELIYLYCVTNRAPQQLIRGEGVYPISYQGLYAIVKRVKENEFGAENLKKNLTDLEWIKEKANTHEKVIEEVMKEACVVPLKFATLFNTEDSLKSMLDEHLRGFKDNLNNLEGKEEWGVKIYCDIEKLKENLTHEDEEFLKIDKEISSSAPGKAFFLKKKKEELLDRLVKEKINKYGQESFERLSRLCLQKRINKLLPKEVTERRDDMILNSAFLFDKNKVGEFTMAVDGLKAKYEDKGLSFDCTGPWPPYNFCSNA